MLVISRKVGESIIISDNIKIIITAVGNDKVSIGIEAPKDVKIIREELLDTINANIASAETVNSDNFKNIADLLKDKMFI